jgi:hypothetical protein
MPFEQGWFYLVKTELPHTAAQNYKDHSEHLEQRGDVVTRNDPCKDVGF